MSVGLGLPYAPFQSSPLGVACCPMDSDSKILHSLLSYHVDVGVGMGRSASGSPASFYCPSPSTNSSSGSPGPQLPYPMPPADPMQSKLYAMLKSHTPPASPYSGGSRVSSPPVDYHGDSCDQFTYIAKRSHAPAPATITRPASHHSDPGAYPMDYSSNCYSAKRTHIPAASDCSADQPIDLSCKRRKLSYDSAVSEASTVPAQSGSILKSLLSTGRAPAVPSTTGSRLGSLLLTGSRTRTPAEDQPPLPAPEASTVTQRVTLAKKNMFPIIARVSDWLVKAIQFAKSLPEFQRLPHNDKVTLTLNAWSRLLLLYMAETGFQFAVTPKHSTDSSPPGGLPAPDVPTMRSVENIQNFIKKYQTLGLDTQEYNYVRIVALFNPGYYGAENSALIDRVNSDTRSALQDHITATHPGDRMRYSQILMCLPSLFSFNSRMIETLFCKHLTETTDMQVLLKEMLQKI